MPVHPHGSPCKHNGESLGSTDRRTQLTQQNHRSMQRTLRLAYSLKDWFRGVFVAGLMFLPLAEGMRQYAIVCLSLAGAFAALHVFASKRAIAIGSSLGASIGLAVWILTVPPFIRQYSPFVAIEGFMVAIAMWYLVSTVLPAVAAHTARTIRFLRSTR